MSFDLAVFRAKSADAGTAAIYKDLCGSAAARKEALALLESSKRPAAFYAALTKQFAELDDDVDESPFAAKIEREPTHVIMNVSFSRAEEVAHAVAKLAAKHDLDVFDPQANKLRRAKEPLAPEPPKKLTPAAAMKLFVEKLTPKLGALGFMPVPKQKHRWGRETKAGVIQHVGLNLATRDVRVDVGFAPVRVLAKVGEIPTMGLEYLYFRGWIPGVPWEAIPGDPFNHRLSELTQIAARATAFAREIEQYALPFFDSVATEKDCVRFFTAKKPPSNARTNWTIDREKRSGPAERFWREDHAKVLIKATLRAPSKA